MKPMLLRGTLRMVACSWIFALLFLPAVQAQVPQELKAPFGFQWGESVDRLEKMLVQAKATVETQEEVGDRLRLTAYGIAQRLLLVSYFYFENGFLAEVELHYGDPSWDTAQYGKFFDQTRRHIDQRYGTGRLIARSKSKQNEVTHSLIGYQWTQVGGTLQLFLFTAEKGAETVRTLSMHYRGS